MIERDAEGNIIRRTRRDGTVIGPDGRILVYGTQEKLRGQMGGEAGEASTRRTSIYSFQSDEVIERDENGNIIRRTRRDGTVIGPDGKILVYGTNEINRYRDGHAGTGGGARRQGSQDDLYSPRGSR